MRSTVRPSPLLLSTVLAVSGLLAQSPPTDPLPSEITESVEVRLVTVDVVALTESDETVPDMTKDDFVLWVDGNRTPIDTLDVFCDGGAEPDPKSRRFGQWQMPPDLTEGTRRVVLVFDYLNAPVHDITQALQDYQAMLKQKTGVDDEAIMVVALTGGIRVEQPFSKNRAEVVKTLHRMEHDITLWNGNFTHLTQYPLWASLRALVTVLRMTPGPKAVVYITANLRSENSYDNEYEQISAIASDARVSFYPVDVAGLVPTDRTGPSHGIQAPAPALALPGPPAGLFRLASMTGGRLTSNTNDYTIGYARARRDLGCHYTIGFYDHHPEANKKHVVDVDSRRKGVHLIYGARYSFPSEKERRTMAIEAAFLVPRQFEGGGLRAHLFPLQPEDTKRWNALLVVDFPAAIPKAESDSTWQFGVVLNKGGTLAHQFDRSLALKEQDDDPEGFAPRVTFVEPVVLTPGNYSLTAVMAGPGDSNPLGSAVDLAIPKLPKREAILSGPILGRRRGDDIVVYGGGDAKGPAGDRVGARSAFRPLLDDEVNRAEPLAALTHVCILVPKAKDGPWSISRTLETADGKPAGSLTDVAFNASKGTKVQCERMLDELPVSQLKPGHYMFRAVLKVSGESSDEPVQASVPFTVIPISQPPPAPSP